MKSNCELEYNDFEISTEIFFVSKNSVIAYVESWFDVDMKIGTKTKDTLNWVDVFALYSPKMGILKCVYFVNSENGIEEENEYALTENEKMLILEKIGNTCQTKSQCSLEEFIRKESMQHGENNLVEST